MSSVRNAVQSHRCVPRVFAASIFYPSNRGSRVLRNVGTLLPDYTALQTECTNLDSQRCENFKCHGNTFCSSL